MFISNYYTFSTSFFPGASASASCRRTPEGREYVGHQATTKTGLPCQRWDMQHPHQHSFTDPQDFPDDSLEAASDYCRNPNGDPEGPWCLTEDPGMFSETCEIPVCKGSHHMVGLFKYIGQMINLNYEGNVFHDWLSLMENSGCMFVEHTLCSWSHDLCPSRSTPQIWTNSSLITMQFSNVVPERAQGKSFTQ